MAKARKRILTSRALGIQAARLAAERHCTDVVMLDLRGISPVTDYFVIASGTSDRQMRAVAEEIADAAAKCGWRPLNKAGLISARWILMDFVDVVVHLFDETHRKFYDLELIWGDGPRVRWQKRVRAGEKRKDQEDDDGPSQ